jgi:hypothetical protein
MTTAHYAAAQASGPGWTYVIEGAKLTLCVDSAQETAYQRAIQALNDTPDRSLHADNWVGEWVDTASDGWDEFLYSYMPAVAH